MAIVAECPTCGKRFKAAESQAGRKAKCSGCAAVFVIGGGGGGTAPEAKIPAASAGVPAATPAVVATAVAAAPVAVRPVGDLPPRPTVTRAAASAASAPQNAAAAPVATGSTTRVQVAPARSVAQAAAPAARVGDFAMTGRATGAEVDASLFSADDAGGLIADAPKKPQAAAPKKPEVVPQKTTVRKAPSARLPEGEIETAPKPAGNKRKGLRRLVAGIVVLGIAGGVAAVVVPRLRKGADAPPTLAGTQQGASAGEQSPLAGGVGPLRPTSEAVWNVTPDRAAKALRLPEDYRLMLPAQAPLRYWATSLQLAASPSPFAAVASAPENDRSAAETISVWNLQTRSREAQFRLAQHLAFSALSRDGAYFAGQAWEESSKSNRIEVWSTQRGQLAHAITIPSTPFTTRAVIGFPAEDQVALLAQSRVQIWDLKARSLLREVEVQGRMEDTRSAASGGFKLVAVADSRALYLVDLAGGKALGPAVIPDALVMHPRRRLSLRAVEFSPDGTELALVFDNGISARRVAVFEVATGRLKEVHFPSAPLYQGGPELQWLSEGRGTAASGAAEGVAEGGVAKQAGNGFLLGGGVLIDRSTSSQAGQVYGDLPDEGLGGWLTGLLDEDRALLAWDKHPKSLVLRAVEVRREWPEWMNVQIASAPAAMYDQLHCVGRAFGNPHTTTALHQAGKLAGGLRFLVVDASFSAGVAAEGPETMTMRPDQFSLIADGESRAAIGTLGNDGVFSLERPELQLKKTPAVTGAATTRSAGVANAGAAFRKRLVFPITGRETSLALRVGTAVRAIEVPGKFSPMPQLALAAPVAERLPVSMMSAPDDTSKIQVRSVSARLGPFDSEPVGAAAEQIPVPLRVTYSSPSEAWLLTVNFEMTVNAARGGGRGASNRPPKLGLLLPDGTQLMPVVQFPGPLPALLTPGEKRTQTCLFVLVSDPGRTRNFRLTCDDVPIATVRPDAGTARLAP